MSQRKPIAVLLLLALPALAQAPPPDPAGVYGDDTEAGLARLEAAVAAEPDSMRWASEYRLAAIEAGAYDRAIAFFAKLTEAHPRSANVLLNHAYAYVDKVPTAGAITQVILGNTAQGLFTRAIEAERSWLALYTRGNGYLYWPTVFGRAPLGVADLEEAVKIARAGKLRPVHVRTWIALGDGHWKVGDFEKARAAWKEGLELFPGDARLADRLAREGDALKELIEAELDPNRRVDTDLKPLWSEP